MIAYAVANSLMNLIGGRFADIIHTEGGARGGRLIFRCILPGLLAGLAALEHYNMPIAAYICAAVMAGSALWFPFGWSFDEITRAYNPGKYAKWIERIGLYIFPYDEQPGRDCKRGILMKSLRGLYDILTFAMLMAINPWAILAWPLTLMMGPIYWLAGKIVGEKYGVMTAEAMYGLYRGILIAWAAGI